MQVLSLAELCPALTATSQTHGTQATVAQGNIHACIGDPTRLPRRQVWLPAYTWLGAYGGFSPARRSTLLLHLQPERQVEERTVRGGRLSVPAGMHAALSGVLYFDNVHFQGAHCCLVQSGTCTALPAPDDHRRQKEGLAWRCLQALFLSL